MKYVIVGYSEIIAKRDGIYCQFKDMSPSGVWHTCSWGKLSDATVFDTVEMANSIINGSKIWRDTCDSRVVAIHPLNVEKR